MLDAKKEFDSEIPNECESPRGAGGREERFGSAVGETHEPVAIVSDDLIQHLFLQDHPERFRYNAAEKCWMHYEDGTWHLDQKAVVSDALASWLRKNLESVIAKFGPPLGDKGQLTSEHYKLIARYSSRTGQDGVLKMAARHSANNLLPTECDKDRHLLNTPTCIVDLTTGNRMPHDPSYRMTRSTKVGPSKRTTPVFDKFLADITCGDASLAAYLQLHCGYCLTGEVREHKVAFFSGGGGNGKSVLLTLMREIMGSYAKTSNAQILMSGAESRHTTEVADLVGARCVMIQELPNDAMWSHQRLMSLTGGDPITARFCGKDNFEFAPQFKLVLAGNRRPAVQNPTAAFLRRMLLIRFEFETDKPDLKLPDKLRAEYGGILQWMIEGAVRYYAEGLNAPESIKMATTEYADDEDDIAQWLDECCVIEKKAFTAIRDLFGSYDAWSEVNGGRKFKKRALGERLRQMKFDPDKQNQQRGYVGLRLKTGAEKP